MRVKTHFDLDPHALTHQKCSKTSKRNNNNNNKQQASKVKKIGAKVKISARLTSASHLTGKKSFNF